MADSDDSQGFSAAHEAAGRGPRRATRGLGQRLKALWATRRSKRPKLGSYRLLDLLGTGGMGEVFLAEHERTGERVALKVLRADDAAALVRLKAEFRAVSDLHHPGLVRLGELDAEAEVPYFTMERVEGEEFDRALALRFSQGDAAGAQALLLRLVDALEALHDRGRLHRDLKPSNVVVTASGRVVVLDFGLTSELGPDGLHRTRKGRVLGTPSFMSPEQARGARLTTASDWYAVGALIVSALLGQPPEAGAAPSLQALRAARQPPVWKSLCLALCHPDAGKRAGGAQVRAAFGQPGRRERPGEAGAFEGRAPALEELDAAAAGDAPSLVLLEGESGIGKSVLLARWAAHMRATSDAVVIVGRCRERERATYKGLDDVWHELAFLAAQGGSDALPEAFPSGRLGVTSLKAALGACARAARVAVVIEDYQWTDDETRQALLELLGDEALPVHWVVSGRVGSTESLRGAVEMPARGRLRELRLEGLDDVAAERLVHALAPGLPSLRVRALCDAAKGHPRFLTELALSGSATPLTPAQLYAGVLARLDSSALALLRAVSAAVNAVPLELALRVADVDRGGMALAQTLCAQRLVSLEIVEGEWRVVCPWLPVREAALTGLGEVPLMRLHRGLALALASRPSTPPSRLVEHYRMAGAAAEAVDAAERAGDDAAAEQAFHTAASLYAEASALSPEGPDTRSRLLRKQADALASAGRSVEANACFEQATRCAEDPATLELAMTSWRAFQQAIGRGPSSRG